MLEVFQLRPGLWRWQAPHPDWIAGGTGASSWPQLVGSTYYEAPEATVVIDPLVPDDDADADRFWQALDRDVERRGLPVATLRTVHWHERSCAAVRARYPVYPDCPPSIEALPLGDPIGETLFYLRDAHALVPGDVILGGVDGGLRLCPPSWYDRSEEERRWHRERMRAALEPALELDIEMVITAHWDPVLAGGGDALRAAVRAAD
jgi:glyoxylase-like metal-dependent hydrolase (beta-lactamase superfamily II)